MSRAASRRGLVAWSLLAVGLVAGGGRAQEAVPPRSVKVLPVFVVPKGEAAPTADQTARLVKHLAWARARYKELLRDRDTFAVAEEKPRVYRSARPLAFYRDQPDGAAPHLADELLTAWKLTRFNCPYVLCCVVVNPRDHFPVGAARPLNGGVNTGGGVIQLSTFAMDSLPNFQSTLQHELGHAFGLPHVDAYGYDMKTNDSVMSYNPKHHTRAFAPSPTPGGFIPEDVRALALNRRVFPKLRYDPARDVPAGYKLAERVIPFGALRIPNQPDGPGFATESGEEFGTKAANLGKRSVAPNAPGKEKGQVTFDAATMWQSAKSGTGWVSVDVSFPYEVELTGVGVHSQHSAEYNAARAVRVAVKGDGPGTFRQVATADLKSPDETVPVPRTKARAWRFEFQAGTSQCVTLRGLRFYAGPDELFPPLVPPQP